MGQMGQMGQIGKIGKMGKMGKMGKIGTLPQCFRRIAIAFFFIVGCSPNALSEPAQAREAAGETSAQKQQNEQQQEAANVETTVQDTHGNPLRDVGVAVYDADGKVVARALTDEHGKARFECLKLGRYRMAVTALRDHWQDGSVEFSLDRQGRAIHWTSSALEPAVATLTQGRIFCPCANGGNDGDTLKDLLKRAANVESVVRDQGGTPLAGVKVVIQDREGQLVAQEVTDDKGAISVECLELGNYTMAVEPLQSGWQPGSVDFSLEQEGRTVRWTTSALVPAVAKLTTGGGICRCGGAWWRNPAVTVPAGAGVVGASIIGIIASDSGGDEPDDQPVPVSPSR